ncbi:cobalt ECF transporter T component CbiQ [Gordonia sp. TBRC 11910]|uniref:Cobalt ECF transporter T component CbiQ n=1 Tax=Gordonia asplenii TaxID=2725283 RepID=A0A848L3H0_9ACTN|nr:cobalt ECF transporter T component CbiQ [Gordonia asplenii]NMO04982.1 cobalt ECF transporter T component CbiQ [Gordonia asplenii]
MSGVHADRLYVAGQTVVHRLPAEVKLAALVLFVFAVVATPRDVVWPYAGFAAVLAALCALARLGPRMMMPRMMIEAPFVVLAVLLPIAGTGERTQVLGMSLSVAGLHAAWGILIKGTLGVTAALIFAATTPTTMLPIALSRLGVPATVTPVMVMMLRYLDLLADEVRRTHIARLSRGDSPRLLHQAGAIAKGVGALFVRAYERGERVHLAMASRGFSGAMPAVLGPARATAAQWGAALVPVVAAVGITLCAWMIR